MESALDPKPAGAASHKHCIDYSLFIRYTRTVTIYLEDAALGIGRGTSKKAGVLCSRPKENAKERSSIWK